MSREFSLSVEKVTEMVNRVAGQYAKDIHSGRGFSEEKFDEYRSELFVKAYEVLSSSEEPVSERLMYKILWNKATDVFNKMMDSSRREYSNQFINKDIEDYLNTEEYSYFDEYEDLSDDQRLHEVLTTLVKLIEDKPSQFRKFVIAKVLLVGVRVQEYLPSEDKDLLEVLELGVCIEDSKKYNSVDEYVLSHINKYSEKSSRTGGPGSFKASKSQAREDYIFSLGLDAITYKTYEITYTYGSEKKVRKVRAYDRNHAERLFNTWKSRQSDSDKIGIYVIEVA